MTHRTDSSSKMMRRLVAGVSVVGALGVLAPVGVSTVSAADTEPGVSQLLKSGGLQTARRGVQVPIAPAPELTPTAPLSSVSIEDRFAAQVIELTNVERAAAGVAPLGALPKLAEAASFHVEDQRNNLCSAATLSHVGSDGSRGVDRILRTGLNISRWAENVACGHPTPEAVVKGWMNSPGHRANVLDARLTHIGVDVARSDSTGLFYWVQNFATLR
jgi:uncharacterized protein YkwD